MTRVCVSTEVILCDIAWINQCTCKFKIATVLCNFSIHLLFALGCNSAVMSGTTATIATMLSFNSKGLAIVGQFYCRFPAFPSLFHSTSLSNTKRSGSRATSDHCLGTKPTPANLHVRQELPPGCCSDFSVFGRLLFSLKMQQQNRALFVCVRWSCANALRLLLPGLQTLQNLKHMKKVLLCWRAETRATEIWQGCSGTGLF